MSSKFSCVSVTESEIRQRLIEEFGTDQIFLNGLPPSINNNYKKVDHIPDTLRIKLADPEEIADDFIESQQIIDLPSASLIMRLGEPGTFNEIVRNLKEYNWYLTIYDAAKPEESSFCIIHGQVILDVNDKERKYDWFIYHEDSEIAAAHAAMLTKILNSDDFTIELYRNAGVLPTL